MPPSRAAKQPIAFPMSQGAFPSVRYTGARANASTGILETTPQQQHTAMFLSVLKSAFDRRQPAQEPHNEKVRFLAGFIQRATAVAYPPPKPHEELRCHKPNLDDVYDDTTVRNANEFLPIQQSERPQFGLEPYYNPSLIRCWADPQKSPIGNPLRWSLNLKN